MNKIKLVFDFDHTLAYRDGMWTTTIYELLQENGYKEIEKEEIEPFTKKGYPWHEFEIPHGIFFKNLSWWGFMEKMVETTLIKLKINAIEANNLSKLFRSKYLNIKKWHLFEDTYDALEKANENNYNCYILSNHTPELRQIITGLKIDTFIKKVYNSAEIGYEKPHHKIFQALLNDLKDEPENFIMIGDNYISDITGARSNSINAIMVRSENSFNYKYYCKDLKNIFVIIDKIIADSPKLSATI